MPYYYYEVLKGGLSYGANAQEKGHTTALEWTYFNHKLMNEGGRLSNTYAPNALRRFREYAWVMWSFEGGGNAVL